MSIESAPFDAVEILQQHNDWRRGTDEDLPMLEPALIGRAIDAAVDEIKRLREIEAAARSVMTASDVRLIAALRHLFRVIRMQVKT